MRLRYRLLVALAIVGLWFVVPVQLAPAARTAVGHGLVDAWLRGTDSPLPALVRNGRLPALDVDLRTSPPTTDPDRLRSLQFNFLESGWSWARAAGVRPETSESGGWPFLVRIGEHGVQAELPRPDGSTARFVRALPTRWSLLPGFALAAFSVLGLPALAWAIAHMFASWLAVWVSALPGAADLVVQGVLRHLPTLYVALSLPFALVVHDSRPAAKRDRTTTWRVLACTAALALGLAGHLELGAVTFANHVGWHAYAPLFVAAVACALMGVLGSLPTALAAVILLAFQMLPRPLFGLVALAFAGYARWVRKARASTP
ncbi:MAG: hypothetical protein JNK15_02880 [Planctomycetes bacterium]|nr:hypothetical protein [Planctomycetota bacterium]